MKRFCICRCLYTKNIFLKDINIHVEYHDKATFVKTYQKLLQQYGIKDENQMKNVIAQIEAEVGRRRNINKESLERQELIRHTYSRLHTDIFQLKKEFLAPGFVDLVEYCQQEDATFEGACDLVSETNISRAYSFPVFTPDFCQQFLEEIVNFENSSCPKGRPNTMNNYGVLLNELGFDDFITTLREEYIRPITSLLFPDWGGANLDSHKAFIVQYKENEDLDLSYHFDNAEVTLNVALSSHDLYSGGDLYFGAMRTENDPETSRKTFKHIPMMGLLHRGQHKHGAYPIHSGARYNLIIWMRSSSVRNKKCPMCDELPDLEDAVGFGGGFTRETVDVCSVV